MEEKPKRKKKPKADPTLRQIALAQAFLDPNKSKKEAMLDAGYSQVVAETGHSKVLSAAGFREQLLANLESNGVMAIVSANWKRIITQEIPSDPAGFKAVASTILAAQEQIIKVAGLAAEKVAGNKFEGTFNIQNFLPKADFTSQSAAPVIDAELVSEASPSQKPGTENA